MVFEASDSETVIAFISDIFHDFNLQGVIVETPEVEPGVDWAENDIIGFDSHPVSPSDIYRPGDGNKRVMGKGAHHAEYSGNN